MSVNVAVTGLHAADNPAPGIGVIRCLRHPDSWDGKIIGLAYDVLDTGIYDDGLLDHAYLIPYPNTDSRSFLERILYIHQQEHLDVIIPTLDSELPVLQKLEHELAAHGISVFLPSKVSTEQISKSRLAEFCKEENIPYPETLIIKDPSDLDNAITKIGFPLVIKGIYYEANICTTRPEVYRHFDNLRLKWGLPIIIQKKLDSDEFDVCCVGDGNGELMGAVPIRKTRLTDKGKAWAAITLKNEELLELSRKIIQKLKWKGPCEVEILKDKKTGEYNLIEINPRFPAWIYLSTGADQNLPKMVVDLAVGKPTSPMKPAQSGICFVRHAMDLVCPMGHIEKLTTLGEIHYSDCK